MKSKLDKIKKGELVLGPAAGVPAQPVFTPSDPYGTGVAPPLAPPALRPPEHYFPPAGTGIRRFDPLSLEEWWRDVTGTKRVEPIGPPGPHGAPSTAVPTPSTPSGASVPSIVPPAAAEPSSTFEERFAPTGVKGPRSSLDLPRD